MRIETNKLICPSCHGSVIRRSRRRTVSDYLLSFSGILPWRCQFCKTRFRARPSSLGSMVYAHCRICGNLELQRIDAGRVEGGAAFLGRILGIPALRCEPCRHKFFSVRPLRREPQGEAAAEGD